MMNQYSLHHPLEQHWLQKGIYKNVKHERNKYSIKVVVSKQLFINMITCNVLGSTITM